MRMTRISIAIAAAMLATPAMAESVASGTVTQNAGSATQLGRLSRTGVQSDFSAKKKFPGLVGTATRYTYSTVPVTFSANAFQKIYYEITVDDPNASAFASAYNGVYDPSNKAANYLGDEGSSGNFFPGDPSYFDIVVPKGGSLVLLFNQVNALYPNVNYTVDAFSDSGYNEIFRSAVPEPATWAMLILGFGIVGASARRRASVRTAVRYG